MYMHMYMYMYMWLMRYGAWQDIPVRVQKLPLEQGVRYCLAKAQRRQPVLTKTLIPSVMDPLTMLAKGCNHPHLVDVVTDRVRRPAPRTSSMLAPWRDHRVAARPLHSFTSPQGV